MESIAHHGLIAALGKILKVEEKINSRLPLQDREDSVTRGQSVMAMIINGLGFIERRLYMVQDFFSDKPVERLLGENVTCEKLNDDNLGRTLDAIYDYNASKLFSEIAFEIGLEHNAMSRFAHLDTTSISVEGNYDSEGIDTQGGANFHITHGYSKDHRKDLKQLMLSLTTTGPASIPIWLETLSGNSADKENFIKTIESAKKFQEELKKSESFVWVADAALYTKDKLLSKDNHTLWVTRVPETISEAKVLVQKNKEEVIWINLENGYSISPQESNYGGVKQRWVLVFSEQAFKNEVNTVEIVFTKKEEILKSAIKKFEKEFYYCEKDAIKAFKKFIKKHPLFILKSKIVRIEGQADGKKGRPREENKVLK
ncbi:MAG: IS1634 family transposase, partial [Bacteroidota bacterium]